MKKIKKLIGIFLEGYKSRGLTVNLTPVMVIIGMFFVFFTDYLNIDDMSGKTTLIFSVIVGLCSIITLLILLENRKKLKDEQIEKMEVEKCYSLHSFLLIKTLTILIASFITIAISLVFIKCEIKNEILFKILWAINLGSTVFALECLIVDSFDNSAMIIEGFNPNFETVKKENEDLALLNCEMKESNNQLTEENKVLLENQEKLKEKYLKLKSKGKKTTKKVAKKGTKKTSKKVVKKIKDETLEKNENELKKQGFFDDEQTEENNE